ncbi:coenzyme A pyrophosphatase [Vibrio sp. 10N.286.49.B3]|uniref:CoA pyrophosphatase n=1 Tax=Vibrio sp. 10N.286.49.B3 TaxID=1880855 RepID=UPI000C81D476|nr:CoA pyrophosphatase [Vibrio sp. 10N.286.49.B3]PMH46579.1 coenzyme A pyrophosphatase [Vibrio sp. 10N.286.49.B3]
MRDVDKETFVQRFQLHAPLGYHPESILRVSHLKPLDLRKAAVLIGLVERESGLNVILTKRSNHLRHHPGQISFPGGKLEPDDHSLQTAAIRETYEEIGIPADKIKVFGHLPPLSTISRFSVTPILAFIDHDYSLKLDTNEVETVFEVPLSFLFNQSNLYSQHFIVKNTPHRLFAIPYQGHFIWGVTAQIIQALQVQLGT